MKRQVLVYTKPAAELKQGERILTNRLTVAEVETLEAFTDSSERPCVEVGIVQGAHKTAVVFQSGETVMVLE